MAAEDEFDDKGQCKRCGRYIPPEIPFNMKRHVGSNVCKKAMRSRSQCKSKANQSNTTITSLFFKTAEFKASDKSAEVPYNLLT